MAACIYADGVGTGKTSIGLQFVSDYAKERGLYTLVVAPAQLRDSLWQDKLISAGLPHEVVSYQELASGPATRWYATTSCIWTRTCTGLDAHRRGSRFPQRG